MISRRVRRAAFRFWFSAALFSALSIAPLAPANAWAPPPRPLPVEPADTDGIDDDVHNDRQNPGHMSPSLTTTSDILNTEPLESSGARMKWEEFGLKVMIQVFYWLDRR